MRKKADRYFRNKQIEAQLYDTGRQTSWKCLCGTQREIKMFTEHTFFEELKEPSTQMCYFGYGWNLLG